ncbi:elongation factor P maturation arginine rhamnosyltransferase EarP [Orrella sp. 11846]|uniref:elongation factor P maturation arginine rhamnosyltransferase EarP n=1 Tax=Orrella sp. 11846 TaxID=3409913 RepID=UPI003B59A99F
MSTSLSRRRIDIFCQVIDNLGDIGVSWRLARQLQHEHHCQVRIWVDDLKALTRLAPETLTNTNLQIIDHIEVGHWHHDEVVESLTKEAPEIVIAAFSCELPASYKQLIPQSKKTTLFSLEYLSAESWVSDFHLQTSLRSDGLKPIYFFPGFTDSTGGLLRETNLITDMRAWSADSVGVHRWLSEIGVDTWWLEHRPQVRLAFGFTYPNAAWSQWLRLLAQQSQPTLLLVPEGMQGNLTASDNQYAQHVQWQTAPFVPQAEFDRFLWSTDLNFVRGEDSLVRAIWAGRPFIWHIYAQDDDLHHDKLSDWLELANMPTTINHLQHQWSRQIADTTWLDQLHGDSWHGWQEACLAHRAQLLAQPSLTTQLLNFASKT